MSAKQFEAGDRNGERYLFAVGDWFRWANPGEIGGVTFVGQIADVDNFEDEEGEAVAGALLRVELNPEFRDIFRGHGADPVLSGNGGTLRVIGVDLLREIFAGRFVKLPMVTGANVSIGDNGTLLTLTDAKGVACAVVLRPGLAEELARQLAHTAAYPWQNKASAAVHCPRHPMRLIALAATRGECDHETNEASSGLCLNQSLVAARETDSGRPCPALSLVTGGNNEPPQQDLARTPVYCPQHPTYKIGTGTTCGWCHDESIRTGTRVRVNRHKERDDGYEAVARAVRESHDGQIGTAEDYPPMTCVWLVRFDDGSRVGYNPDELTALPVSEATV